METFEAIVHFFFKDLFFGLFSIFILWPLFAFYILKPLVEAYALDTGAHYKDLGMDEFEYYDRENQKVPKSDFLKIKKERDLYKKLVDDLLEYE